MILRKASFLPFMQWAASHKREHVRQKLNSYSPETQQGGVFFFTTFWRNVTKPKKCYKFQQLEDFLLICGGGLSVHRLPIFQKKLPHRKEQLWLTLFHCVFLGAPTCGDCPTVLFDLLYSPAFSSYLLSPGTSRYLHDNLNIQRW